MSIRTNVCSNGTEFFHDDDRFSVYAHERDPSDDVASLCWEKRGIGCWRLAKEGGGDHQRHSNRILMEMRNENTEGSQKQTKEMSRMEGGRDKQQKEGESFDEAYGGCTACHRSFAFVERL